MCVLKEGGLLCGIFYPPLPSHLHGEVRGHGQTLLKAASMSPAAQWGFSRVVVVVVMGTDEVATNHGRTTTDKKKVFPK